jgi:hypothetical protein
VRSTTRQKASYEKMQERKRFKNNSFEKTALKRERRGNPLKRNKRNGCYRPLFDKHFVLILFLFFLSRCAGPNCLTGYQAKRRIIRIELGQKDTAAPGYGMPFLKR